MLAERQPVMKSKLESICIENFRSFRKLEVQGLGLVNLVTGQNNSGKSTLLEAIRLMVSEVSIGVLDDVLRVREEDRVDSDPTSCDVLVEPVFPFSTLFRGHPTFPEPGKETETLLLESVRGGQSTELTFRAGWRGSGKQKTELVLHDTDDADSDTGPRWEPRMVVLKEGIPLRVLLWDGSGRHWSNSWKESRPDLEEPVKVPCLYSGPADGSRSTAFGGLWDKIALSDLEGEVVQALRLVSPEIEAVSMVAGEAGRRSRKAIVRVKGFAVPLPIRSFGDGVNRLFGMALCLVNAKGGVLLIDEFENGIHYSVLHDIWRAVFALAKRLEVQVFATTHSWDCIEAFQKAASEVPDEGVLIRLSRHGENSLASVFREEELAIVTREHIEVR